MSTGPRQGRDARPPLHSPPAPARRRPWPANSPAVLRNINASVVLHAIRHHAPLSRAEVARRTGLSRPTVNEVVQQLMDVGYVRQTEPNHETQRERRPGRRGQLLAFRADAGYALGLDIGGTKIQAVISDLNGDVLATERRVPPVGDAKRTLSAVRWTVSSVLKKGRVPRASLRAVAAATPGVIDPVTGSVSLAPQLPGWEGTHLLEELQRSFQCPVVVEGEVRAALIGEAAWGVAKGHRHVAFIHLATGIGSAIMIDRAIYRGTYGAAGEIGFLPVSPPVPPGAPPNFGALEYAAGGTAFARLGKAAAERQGGEALRRLAGGSERVDARVVCEAAAEGDVAAQTIVAQLSQEIARGVASVGLVLDPELIVIGGGLSQAGLILLEPITRALERLVPRPPRVELSALGADGVAFGALRLALDLVEDQLFNFEQRPLNGVPSTSLRGRDPGN